MAVNKTSKASKLHFDESPRIYTGANDPNVLEITPEKIGDLFVDTTFKQLYFAMGVTSTSWGTCGTAGG